MNSVIGKLWIKTNTGGLARYETIITTELQKSYLETHGLFVHYG